jgi:hypothetical protein
MVMVLAAFLTGADTKAERYVIQEAGIKTPPSFQSSLGPQAERHSKSAPQRVSWSRSVVSTRI